MYLSLSAQTTGNDEQMCSAFDFQFAHPSMRFLLAGAPAVTQFRELRIRAARRRRSKLGNDNSSDSTHRRFPPIVVTLRSRISVG